MAKDAPDPRSTEEAEFEVSADLAGMVIKALDVVDLGFAVTDVNAVCLWANAGFESSVGSPRKELIGKPLTLLAGQGSGFESLRELCSHVASGQFWRAQIQGRATVDPQVKSLDCSVYPIATDTGAVDTFLVMVRELSAGSSEETERLLVARLAEIDTLRTRLQGLVIRDELTGVYSHRFLEECLERELSRSLREKHPLALAAINIDKLTAINEAHGTAAGDEVLRSFSATVSQSTRIIDTLCRVGGDEFVLVLPRAGLIDAERKLDFLRRLFDSTTLNCDGREVRASFSVGVAVYPDHGVNAEEITKAARVALNEAKECGGNQVVAFHFRG